MQTRKNKFEVACLEWLKGCSCSTEQSPWECRECTRAFMKHLMLLKGDILKTGCGCVLKQGQWFRFCGETDMGQTAPVLCTNCGGEFILEENE